MKQEIIDKYKLTASHVCLDQSFRYGIIMYEYKEGVFFGCCEADGTPMKNRVNIFKSSFNPLKCSEKFLINVSKDAFDRLLSQKLEANPLQPTASD